MSEFFWKKILIIRNCRDVSMIPAKIDKHDFTKIHNKIQMSEKLMNFLSLTKSIFVSKLSV